ncbi:MAG: methylthioribulose 1-phosphate dehydratase [Deltaproteobacteria bacterium]|nr:MAG: methylthioribulose 1-phosphate dehydratase [Deltaproteobacteria bacterium]
MTDPRDALAAVGRSFYARGWMLGTGGNLSARLPDGTFWITASGVPKGRLEREHFVRMTVEGEILEAPNGARPSAETSLHQAIYAWSPDQQACLHVHTVSAVVAARLHPGDLPLPPVEMVKGYGIFHERPRVCMPVFDNPLAVPEIAQAVRARFASTPPDVPVFMIRDHGITAWGRSLNQAFNRVEVSAYLLDLLVEGARTGVEW